MTKRKKDYSSTNEKSRKPYDEEGAMHNKFLDYFAEATAEDTAITQ